jgi:hypothetical protein
MTTTRKPNRIRRITTRVILFLLIGAIVNVAVAWSLAVWGQQDAWLGKQAVKVPDEWPSRINGLGWPNPTHAIMHQGDGVGVRVLEISGGDLEASFESSGPGSDKTWVVLTASQFGLPLPCMQWEQYGVRAGPRSMAMAEAADDAAGMRAGLNVSRIVGGSSASKQRFLPLTILTWGFVIDTIAFASLLMVVFVFPQKAKRMIRRQRGLCPDCGFNLTGTEHTNCPECGTPIKQVTAS